MQRIVLTFGLIAGAVLAVMMLLTIPFQEKIGFDKGMIIGYTTMVLAFLMVWFGVREYREQVGGGTVGFGRAFAVGISIVGVASVCYVITWQLIYHQIAPDFMDKYIAWTLDQARASGATEAAVATQAAEMAEFQEMYKNPLVNIAFTLLEPLPVGLLATLVSAGVLSRKRATT